MAITAPEQDRLAGLLSEIRPHLNERQWRLLLGAEARAVGRGGIKLVARVVGASVDTLGRGARELEAGIEPDRAGAAGRRGPAIGGGPRGGEARHLVRHDFHGDWNYTVTARSAQNVTRPNGRD